MNPQSENGKDLLQDSPKRHDSQRVSIPTGLNTDPKPFDHAGSCTAGGLYFSDRDNIVHFLHYGERIAKVPIPSGSKMAKDRSFPIKFKADRIILSEIQPIEDCEQRYYRVLGPSSTSNAKPTSCALYPYNKTQTFFHF